MRAEEDGESLFDGEDTGKDADARRDAAFARLALTIHERELSDLPHIKEYRKLRKLHGLIVESMIEYVQNGRFVPTRGPVGDLRDGTVRNEQPELRAVGVTFDMETYDGSLAYYDTQIYESFPGANSVTDEYLRRGHYRTPEKTALLQGMRDSVCGFFEIDSVEPSSGYVLLREVFTNREYKVVDFALSFKENDKIYLYNRVITVGSVSFCVGVSLVFLKTDPFAAEFIERHRADYNPTLEWIRFAELYNRYKSDSKRVAVGRHEIKQAAKTRRRQQKWM
jgi:hypothetical protein